MILNVAKQPWLRREPTKSFREITGKIRVPYGEIMGCNFTGCTLRDMASVLMGSAHKVMGTISKVLDDT